MQLTEQQILEDDKRYGDRDILRELRHYGRELPCDIVTDEDIRIRAWLCRAAYQIMMKSTAELIVENDNLKKQLSAIRAKAKAIHDAVTELDGEVNL